MNDHLIFQKWVYMNFKNLWLLKVYTVYTSLNKLLIMFLLSTRGQNTGTEKKIILSDKWMSSYQS